MSFLSTLALASSAPPAKLPWQNGQECTVPSDGPALDEQDARTEKPADRLRGLTPLEEGASRRIVHRVAVAGDIVVKREPWAVVRNEKVSRTVPHVGNAATQLLHLGDRQRKVIVLPVS